MMTEHFTTNQADLDIEGHLMHIALNEVSAVMRMGALHLMGRLALTEGIEDVDFVLDRSTALDGGMVSGMTVQIEYWNGDISSRFDSSVRQQEGARIRLSAPTSVTRSDRRLVPRCTVEGTKGFRFLLGSEPDMVAMDLVDLSNTGLAFRAPLSMESLLSSEPPIVGWLGLPEQAVIPVQVDVRNCREVGSTLLVGARFFDIRRADRKAISQLIIRLRQSGLNGELDAYTPGRERT